jgi:nicotinate (nicotinamide) nucleotide adenylyltransferase/ribosome silencing factor RsfS/YbeB/iojap
VARIGLLGGTFNPPHLAHLVCGQEALVQLELDRVLLVPVGVPPHKTVEADPGIEHRIAMCEAAVARDERFGVSRVEVDRPGRSFTVDTLRALHAQGRGDTFTFIVGGDMAHSLPAWRDPEGVLALAELAVAERDGVPREPCRGVRARPFLRHAAAGHLQLADAPARGRGPAGPLPGARRGGGVHRTRRALPRAGTGDGRRPPILGGYRMTESTSLKQNQATQDPAALARLVADYAADKKAIDVAELDLRGVLGYTDFFVVCSGNTDRQTKAIHDGIHQGLKKDHGLLPRRVEGLGEARWILMDYLDVVVHIFTPEAREFYRLEQLWGEAPRHAVAE